jgi:hypothetical protein
MNRHSIALLVLLALIGVGLFSLIQYQHGKALPPGALAAQASTGGKAAPGGGLIINSVILPGDSAPLAGTAPVVPAAPAAAAQGGSEAGATCP